MLVDWSIAASFWQIISSICMNFLCKFDNCAKNLELCWSTERYHRISQGMCTFERFFFASRLDPYDCIKHNLLMYIEIKIGIDWKWNLLLKFINLILFLSIYNRLLSDHYESIFLFFNVQSSNAQHTKFECSHTKHNHYQSMAQNSIRI